MVRQYVLGLIGAALLAAVAVSLAGEGTHKQLVRLLCGIVMTLVFLRPLAGWRFEPDLSFMKEVLDAGSREANAGQNLAREEQIRRITAGVESYILDKADREGADLTVEVTLTEDLLPAGVVLRGKASREAKENLSRMLEQDLGITKENQLWTG